MSFGEDGPDGFVAWEDGEAIPIRDDGTGTWALRFEHRVQGLDVREAVTVVLRLSIAGGPTEDYLAQSDLTCTGEQAAHAAWAALPDEDQADPWALDGETAAVDVVFTDVDGRVAEAGIDLLLESP